MPHIAPPQNKRYILIGDIQSIPTDSPEPPVWGFRITPGRKAGTFADPAFMRKGKMDNVGFAAGFRPERSLP
jgi:hypothetical protein